MVKETQDFLERTYAATADNGAKTRRSDTTIIVKNLPAGEQFCALLRKQFEQFGEVKRIEYASGKQFHFGFFPDFWQHLT